LDPLVARFGNPAMRLVIMCDWTNHKGRLNPLQKSVLLRLLYSDVHDPFAASEAILVLKSHLVEDEDTNVRHLIYLALTTNNPLTREAALSALRSVSTKHTKPALASFLYILSTLDAEQRA